MARRRFRERTVFLPWERQGATLRRLGLGRLRPFVFGAALLGFLMVLWTRSTHRAAVRSTRATLLTTRRALDSFRADHEGQCPGGGLEELVARGYVTRVPRDAWDQPLSLLCPARHPGKTYDLSSCGPDGEPGGLDRVE